MDAFGLAFDKNPLDLHGAMVLLSIRIINNSAGNPLPEHGWALIFYRIRMQLEATKGSVSFLIIENVDKTVSG